ncbi:MAG: hypothetical protein QF834_07190 [Candidatus Thalassarchaeaceae archaeon]|nr:hypothetical protein [Candidatus Thalassarchaeaceae archaeon]
MGTPRSGHSIIGAILDAHPLAVVSHEVNALKKISEGMKRDELFSMIIENSENQATAGRSQSDADHASGYGQQLSGESDEAYAERLSDLSNPEPYWFDYVVANQFQGVIGGPIRVIGDKKGGGTTKIIAQDQRLLRNLQNVVDLPIFLIHVIRNPYDNIATMARRTGTQVDQQITHYNWLNEQIEPILRNSTLPCFQIYHEDFVSSPETGIRDLFRWLDLPLDSDFIDACSSIVYDKPHHSRDLVGWDDDAIMSVEGIIEKWPTLHRYSNSSN